jgi:hypothetical protein
MKFSKLYTVATALLVFAGTSSAAHESCLQGGNLLDLLTVSAHGGCTIDDKLFSDFSIVGQLSAAGVGVDTGVTAGGNHFLTFIGNGLFTATGGVLDPVTIERTIIYTVTSLSGATITDLHLGVGNLSQLGTGGSATVTERACFGIDFTCASPNVTLTAGPGGVADEIFAPQTQLTVFKTIAVTAEAGGGIATLESVTNEVSQIPEPGTWVFMSTGLMGLALVQRRLRRRT